MTYEYTSTSPEETRRIGNYLGTLAAPGDVYLLHGQLGAGKTCLTQGIACGLGIRDNAVSPTFVLMREMIGGRLPLYHIDFYRLDNLAEIADLGLDDYFYGHGVCVVEWAEKGQHLLPNECLNIYIAIAGETQRQFTFKPCGKRYEELLNLLRVSLEKINR